MTTPENTQALRGPTMDCLKLLGDLATELTRRAAIDAPGAAGTPWPEWRPTPTEPDAQPGSFRIGTITGMAGQEAPATVDLLDLGHIAFLTGINSQTAADAAVGLIVRMLGTMPEHSKRPLKIQLYAPWDIGSFGAFGRLTEKEVGVLQTARTKEERAALLKQLDEDIERITVDRLAGTYGSLREMAATTGVRPEPWRVVVLFSDGKALSDAEQEALERIIENGPACGISLIMHNVRYKPHSSVQEIKEESGATVSSNSDKLPIALDGRPNSADIQKVVEKTAERAERPAPSRSFVDALPPEIWKKSSAKGISATLGVDSQGRDVEIVFDDVNAHALIGGMTGKGKTNAIKDILASVTSNFPPEEVEIYLIDLKEDVEFARFGPSDSDPSYLPHIRALGYGVNEDRRTGLAMLRHIHKTLIKRARDMKASDVTKFSDFRAKNDSADGPAWPRTLLFIDEFQVLFEHDDDISAEAASILNDIGRRGRSQGVHLILASQNLEVREARLGQSGLFRNFGWRIALPGADDLLGSGNRAVQDIEFPQAIVNRTGGTAIGNATTTMDGVNDDLFRTMQRHQWSRRDPNRPPPQILSGKTRVPLVEAPSFRRLTRETGKPPTAIVAKAIAVQDEPVEVDLSNGARRHLVVFGTTRASRIRDAHNIIEASARSVARQVRPDTRFSIIAPDERSIETAERFRDAIGAEGGTNVTIVTPDNTEAFLQASQAQVANRTGGQHYILFSGPADNSDVLDSKDEPASQALAKIMQTGGQRGTHVIGWWSAPSSMSGTLGFNGESSIDAWAATDVPWPELRSLAGSHISFGWSPEEHRVLVMDRATGDEPRIAVPYISGNADEDE